MKKRFAVAILHEGAEPDRYGDVFARGSASWDETIPVYHGTVEEVSRCIGHAKLSRGMLATDMVIAEIELYEGALQRYGDTISSLTPCAFGSIILKEGHRIENCRIKYVGLSTDKNANPKILTIAEQLEGTTNAVTKTRHKCTCTMFVLMGTGCKCGGT